MLVSGIHKCQYEIFLQHFGLFQISEIFVSEYESDAER
jgi:hypothetical protein